MTTSDLPAGEDRATSAFVALSFAIVAAASLDYTTDPDLWWHLRTGDVITDRGVPRTDPFSWTVPGREWVAHEWLTDVVLWLTWSAGGHPALIVLFGLIATGAFWLAYLVARTVGVRRLPAASLAAAAAVGSAVIVGVRPQVLNLVGLAAVMLVLERVRVGQWKIGRLWWLVPIMVLWVNLHAGYLTGFAVLAVWIVGEWWSARTNRPALDPAGRSLLWKVTAVAALATIVNPNGLALWRYPIDTLRSSAMRDYIAEWQSPNFHNPWFWPFAALMILGVVAAVRSPKAMRLTSGLLLVGSAFAGLQSARHIPLFCIVAVPVIAQQLDAALQSRPTAELINAGAPTDGAPAQSSGAVIPVGAMVLGAAIVACVLVFTISRNSEAITDTYPVDAVAWAAENGLTDQPVFNDYEWGGYLIWEDVPVFIDGRADLYGDQFLEEFIATVRITPEWERPLDEWQPAWVLTSATGAQAAVLDASAVWDRAYEDEVAVIFRRQ